MKGAAGQGNFISVYCDARLTEIILEYVPGFYEKTGWDQRGDSGLFFERFLFFGGVGFWKTSAICRSFLLFAEVFYSLFRKAFRSANWNLLIFWSGTIWKRLSVFISVNRSCFKMKLDTPVSTWYIHFIFFFFTSICKITTASNNFTPCIYL